MFKIKRQFKAGFSIVEVMAALFVVVIGLVAVLSLMVQSIQSQNVNKGALVAYQLAQEGIELVRHTRDSNWAASQVYNAYLDPGHYIISYRDSSPHPITFSGQEGLKKDSSGYYYNPIVANDPNLNSGFSRTIDIYKANDYAILVRSTVTWSDHSKNFSYVLDATLYDWK